MNGNFPDTELYTEWQDWAAAYAQEMDRVLASIQQESTGRIAIFRGTAVGAGYVKCDGSTLVAGSYPALVAFLGTNVLPNYTSPFATSVVGIKT